MTPGKDCDDVDKDKDFVARSSEGLAGWENITYMLYKESKREM